MKPFNCINIVLSLLVAWSCQAKSHTPPGVAPGPDTYIVFKARNGVEIPYRLILPDSFNPTKTYPAVVAFSNMTHDPELGDDLIDRMRGEGAFKDYLLVVPLAPKSGQHGWMNHPAHHALEDLLDEIKEEYKVLGGQFSNLGYRDGTIPALTWMHMSFRYFNSLVLASCYTLDDREMADAKKISGWKKKVVLITGAEDPSGLKQVAAFESALPGIDPELVSIISEDDNRSLDNFFASDFNEFITEHLSE